MLGARREGPQSFHPVGGAEKAEYMVAHLAGLRRRGIDHTMVDRDVCRRRLANISGGALAESKTPIDWVELPGGQVCLARTHQENVFNKVGH